ncbi:hypothetical protein [Streptomyces sp. NPDC006307]|uniref:hypothetical protein n=1 Tax=Streptomyces sp. NPDC006307 TaxID=3156748 RepID=UPI0033B754EC
MSLRDEVLAPLRGLHPRALAAGSVVLVRLLCSLLGCGLRAALAARRRRAAAPAWNPATASKRKKPRGKKALAKAPHTPAAAGRGQAITPEKIDAPPAADQPPAEAPTPAPAGKTGSAADTLESYALGVLLVLVLGAVLRTAVPPLAAALGNLLAPYVPVVLGLLGVAWIIAATMLAPSPADEDTPKNDHENDGVGEQSDLSPEDEQAARVAAAELWLVRLVLGAVLTAVAGGRRGVHLATIVEGLPDPWTVGSLRASCERVGLPVKKINIRGVGNTWGVHIDELESTLGMPLEDALDRLAQHPASTPSATPAESPVHTPNEAPAEGLEEAPAGPPAGKSRSADMDHILAVFFPPDAPLLRPGRVTDCAPVDSPSTTV